MKVHSALPSPTGTPLKSPLWSRAGTRVPSPVQEEEEDNDDQISVVVLAANPAQILSEMAIAKGEDSTKLTSTRLVKDLGLSRLEIDTSSVHDQESPFKIKPRPVSWPMTPMSPWSATVNVDGGNVRKQSGQQQWQGKDVKRPFFSIIADGVHVHPQAVAMAYNAHPSGCVLVSDGECGLDNLTLFGFPKAALSV